MQNLFENIGFMIGYLKNRFLTTRYGSSRIKFKHNGEEYVIDPTPSSNNGCGGIYIGKHDPQLGYDIVIRYITINNENPPLVYTSSYAKDHPDSFVEHYNYNNIAGVDYVNDTNAPIIFVSKERLGVDFTEEKKFNYMVVGEHQLCQIHDNYEKYSEFYPDDLLSYEFRLDYDVIGDIINSAVMHCKSITDGV